MREDRDALRARPVVQYEAQVEDGNAARDVGRLGLKEILGWRDGYEQT